MVRQGQWVASLSSLTLKSKWKCSSISWGGEESKAPKVLEFSSETENKWSEDCTNLNSSVWFEVGNWKVLSWCLKWMISVMIYVSFTITSTQIGSMCKSCGKCLAEAGSERCDNTCPSPECHRWPPLESRSKSWLKAAVVVLWGFTWMHFPTLCWGGISALGYHPWVPRGRISTKFSL